MQVRLHEDAHLRYIARNRDFRGDRVNREWVETLKKVDGQTLEVETEYLFSDQFNTAPIPGVSENGLRLMVGDVAEVIDDERPGRGRCQWCGKTVVMDKVRGDTCPLCEVAGYITAFSQKGP
jgi:hypothetical protein